MGKLSEHGSLSNLRSLVLALPHGIVPVLSERVGGNDRTETGVNDNDGSITDNRNAKVR